MAISVTDSLARAQEREQEVERLLVNGKTAFRADQAKCRTRPRADGNEAFLVAGGIDGIDEHPNF